MTGKRLDIGVATTNPNFIKPIIEELGKHHNIHWWKPTQDGNLNMFMFGLLENKVDCWFVDFAQSPLPVMSRFKKPIFVRLHRIEVYQFLWEKNDFDAMNWNNISMIFSCEHIKDKWFGFVRDRGNPDRLKLRDWTVNLTNMVDLDLFKFKGSRPRSKPYQMCMVGRVIPKKRVYSLIQALQHLPDWELNIVGNPQNSGNGTVEYLININDLIEELGIGDRVHFLNHMEHEILPDFFNTQDIIISNSNEEGTHVSVAEAMACGVYPLINCWKGADKIYPKESIFHSETELIEKVNEWASLESRVKNNLSEMMFQYSERMFDKDNLAMDFRKFVEKVMF